MSSTDSIISASSSRSASLHGANVTPQLPSTTEVTPCQHDDEPIGSQASCASRWVWMSTNPGVTMQPSASIVRRPSPSTRPTATTRSPSMATSATCAGAPVPSTTEPLRMTRSCIVVPLDPDVCRQGTRQPADPAKLAPCPAPTKHRPQPLTCRSVRSTPPTRAPTRRGRSSSGASRTTWTSPRPTARSAATCASGGIRTSGSSGTGPAWSAPDRPLVTVIDHDGADAEPLRVARAAHRRALGRPPRRDRRSTTSPSGSRRSAWPSTTRPRPTGAFGATARRSGFDLEWDTDGLPFRWPRR